MKTVKITGMHCEGCVKRLQNAFNEEGIKADISLAEGKADFEDTADIANVKGIIEDLGFEAE